MARSFRIGVALLVMGAVLPAAAKDHFLTIGGGSSASNNQVSLEKNVLFFQRFLDRAHLASLPHEIFFSDGLGGARDLQFFDPTFQPPRANELLAQIFNRERDLTTQYRAHAIPHLTGPSTREALAKWFDTVGQKLGDGDRLFIYYTGHGGAGRGRRGTPPVDQTMALWNEDSMTVSEFVGLLDKLPARVKVMLIMVQCYSGGFADVIYNGGDANKGLSSKLRAGFFATIPTRVAAGCTSDVDEENYREYSTYFWAALSGKTRTGEAVNRPDYDNDGHVSLAEAHAYTVIHSETIDIPNKTSEALLRKFSKAPARDGGGLVPADTDFSRLCGMANPIDRAVMSELATELKLEGNYKTAAARRKADDVAADRKRLDDQRRQVETSRNKLRNELATRLRSKWPELANLLHPDSLKLLRDEPDAIVKFIEASPRFKEFEQANEKIDGLDKESDSLERTWVKCQRFIRTAETTAMEFNLPKVANQDVVQRYHELQDIENGPLGD
jgi:hypothetical protein